MDRGDILKWLKRDGHFVFAYCYSNKDEVLTYFLLKFEYKIQELPLRQREKPSSVYKHKINNDTFIYTIRGELSSTEATTEVQILEHILNNHQEEKQERKEKKKKIK